MLKLDVIEINNKIKPLPIVTKKLHNFLHKLEVIQLCYGTKVTMGWNTNLLTANAFWPPRFTT